MKSLQITLMIAIFCLTISGTTNNNDTKVTFDQAEIEAYKELKKNSDLLIVDVTRPGLKKPGHEL